MLFRSIEEMAWAPKYGLKGMIDASVSVKVLLKGNEADEKVMPLEFKTGKAMSGQARFWSIVLVFAIKSYVGFIFL